MKLKAALTGLMLLLLASCAQNQAPKISNTPWPQVTLPAISKDDAKEKFMAATVALGAILVDDTNNTIKLYKPLTGSDAQMVNMLIGSTRSEPPRDYFTFIFTNQNSGTFVVTQYWREVQQYNGSWNRVEMQNNSNYYNSIQQMLWDVKKKVEEEGGLQ